MPGCTLGQRISLEGFYQSPGTNEKNKSYNNKSCLAEHKCTVYEIFCFSNTVLVGFFLLVFRVFLTTIETWIFVELNPFIIFKISVLHVEKMQSWMVVNTM